MSAHPVLKLTNTRVTTKRLPGGSFECRRCGSLVVPNKQYGLTIMTTTPTLLVCAVRRVRHLVVTKLPVMCASAECTKCGCVSDIACGPLCCREAWS